MGAAEFVDGGVKDAQGFAVGGSSQAGFARQFLQQMMGGAVGFVNGAECPGGSFV